ncbi:MAG: homoserine dehydrogenase, partial [Eggerthellaceae bacterium]|nr:homoserine dehydrogenase [Eggerthellaceae bacterium]
MTVKIGLVGTGTVGGGCIDIINAHKDDFKHRLGIDIELVRVCSLSKEEADAHGVGDLFTSDFHDIINDPEINLVIELIGGTGVAHTIVTEALKAGKYVVTANKALMATAGEEIFRLVEEAGVEIGFEASVGGGIPIIDPLKHNLISNEISSVLGIVNGTTNYMLTRMDEDGM